MCQNFLPDFRDKRVLDLEDLLLGGEDLFLIFLERGRDVPFAVDERLLADIIPRREMLVRFGDLDVIAEDVVEPDLERIDPRAPDLVFLKFLEPLPAVFLQVPQGVELGMIAGPDDLAFGARERDRFIDSAFQIWTQIRDVFQIKQGIA